MGKKQEGGLTYRYRDEKKALRIKIVAKPRKTTHLDGCDGRLPGRFWYEK